MLYNAKISLETIIEEEEECFNKIQNLVEYKKISQKNYGFILQYQVFRTKAERERFEKQFYDTRKLNEVLQSIFGNK